MLSSFICKQTVTIFSKKILKLAEYFAKMQTKFKICHFPQKFVKLIEDLHYFA